VRSVVILSLLIPIVAALFSRDFDSGISHAIWGFVAVRLVAIPSITLDYYFVFFADNPLTYFCQINFVKVLTDCPYKEQLGAVFQKLVQTGKHKRIVVRDRGRCLGWTIVRANYRAHPLVRHADRVFFSGSAGGSWGNSDAT
jgi:hypothetical protein